MLQILSFLKAIDKLLPYKDCGCILEFWSVLIKIIFNLNFYSLRLVFFITWLLAATEDTNEKYKGSFIYEIHHLGAWRQKITHFLGCHKWVKSIIKDGYYIFNMHLFTINKYKSTNRIYKFTKTFSLNLFLIIDSLSLDTKTCFI